jgi:hypothetical protein
MDNNVLPGPNGKKDFKEHLQVSVLVNYLDNKQISERKKKSIVDGRQKCIVYVQCG